MKGWNFDKSIFSTWSILKNSKNFESHSISHFEVWNPSTSFTISHRGLNIFRNYIMESLGRWDYERKLTFSEPCSMFPRNFMDSIVEIESRISTKHLYEHHTKVLWTRNHDNSLAYFQLMQLDSTSETWSCEIQFRIEFPFVPVERYLALVPY